MAIGLFIATNALVWITAEWLIRSIDGLSSGGGHIAEEFIGLIVLPMVGNAPEYVSIITASTNDEIGLCIDVAIESSLYVTFFGIPLTIVLGWITGKPISFRFDLLESIFFFLSVLLAVSTVRDGRMNWMKGLILISLYFVIGLATWSYPGYGVE